MIFPGILDQNRPQPKCTGSQHAQDIGSRSQYTVKRRRCRKVLKTVTQMAQSEGRVGFIHRCHRTVKGVTACATTTQSLNIDSSF